MGQATKATDGLFQGKYRLGQVLRQDASTVAYEAEHTTIERPVEVRVLVEGVPIEGAAATRLGREARAAIAHRNIQSIIDTGKDADGRPFAVYEAIRGRPLRALLAEGSEPMPLPRALAIVVQLLEGLDALHKAGITHRAVGPDCVFVEDVRSGAVLVKLTGFVDAVFHNEKVAPAPIGTLTTPYVAPEFQAGQGTAPPLDVYSAGVLAREVLTGSVDGSMDSLPDEVRRAVDRATAVSPEERFPSAELFLQSLALVERGRPRRASRTSIDSGDRLAEDLAYLQRRRTTQLRKRDPSGPSTVPLRTVLLVVESVYKLTGAGRWVKFTQRMPEVETILPGAAGLEQFVKVGVPMDLFRRLLTTADEFLGRGDLVTTTALGEAIAAKGLAGFAPDLTEPETPMQFVQAFPTIWGRLARQGVATVIDARAGAARIAISEQSSPSLEFGAWVSGFVRGFLLRSGAIGVEVAMPASQALGDRADVFGLTWRQ
ncbi:MAG: protein kinase [Myxococcales bacterium]|nr:protein kinase [Myxococcales bacterium]